MNGVDNWNQARSLSKTDSINFLEIHINISDQKAAHIKKMVLHDIELGRGAVAIVSDKNIHTIYKNDRPGDDGMLNTIHNTIE